MDKKHLFWVIGVFVLAFMGSFLWRYYQQNDNTTNLSSFNRELPISKSTIEWEFVADSTKQEQFTLYISPLTLKPDNTLDFSIAFPKAPVVLESILGSQLGREIFQIPWQTINSTDTLYFSGIDMSRFNPFEPFRFNFVYEYDSGYRARHQVEFEIQ
ncbi:hypothetical protein EP331_09890 [bacterium]|nr:MAG: hypothetical protein EP331_09890 [bacterium]